MHIWADTIDSWFARWCLYQSIAVLEERGTCWKRSRVAATIGRYKQVIGGGLRSRKDRRRTSEVGVAIHALNWMLKFGRPIAVRIA
jgi:hypothetical protein